MNAERSAESGGASVDPPRSGGLLGTVVRGTGIAGGGFALTQALNLIAYVMLARLLLPEEFGVFAAATALIGFALWMSDAGIVQALVQRRDRIEEAANTAVISTAASGIALSLLSLASAPLLGLFFDNSQVPAVAAVMSGFILLHSLGAVPTALLQRRFAFGRRVISQVLPVVAFGTGAIISASLGFGVWALAIGQYAYVVVELVSAWLLASWRPALGLASFAVWRELVSFARHVLAASVMRSAAHQLDVFIVGRAFGPDLLGNYRYATRLAALPFAALYASISYVLLPAFSRISHEPARVRAALLRTLRWTAIIAFPLSLLLVPLGEPLAVILFGEIWREAGIATAAMAGYAAGNMLVSVVGQGLKALDRPDRLPWMQGVIAVSTIGLMVAMVPAGFRAVAAAMSAGPLVGAVYALWTGSRIMGIPRRAVAATTLPALTAAALMAAAILWLEAAVDAESYMFPANVLLLIGEGLAGLAVFAAIIATISSHDRSELTWAWTIGARKLRSRR